MKKQIIGAYGYYYDDEKNIIYPFENIDSYGFFSTFTLMLTSLMGVYFEHGKTPDVIGGNILNNLKSVEERNNGYDMYHHFFHIDKDYEIEIENLPPMYNANDHHKIYTEEELKYYYPFFRKYFNLNDNVQKKVDFLMKKYNIDLENTVAIVYRGTDKWTDLGGFLSMNPALYLRLGSTLKEKNQNLRFLVQTEDEGVRRQFSQSYIKSFYFDETSVSKSTYQPIFLENIGNKFEWAEYYVASLWILSKCKILITYTGNSAFFMYLNRNTTKNMYQEITFTETDFLKYFANNK